jgi:hypothetical protein
VLINIQLSALDDYWQFCPLLPSNLIMPQGEQLAISRTINPLITPSQSKHAPNQS